MENRLLRGIQGLRLLSLLTLVQARTREAAPRPPVCTGVGRSGRWASGRCSRVHSLLPALCLTRGSCSEGRDSGVEGGEPGHVLRTMRALTVAGSAGGRQADRRYF